MRPSRGAPLYFEDADEAKGLLKELQRLRDDSELGSREFYKTYPQVAELVSTLQIINRIQQREDDIIGAYEYGERKRLDV